jgi:hypothetical protein
MTDSKNLCPISDTGNHRYFIFKAVEVFEPLQVSLAADGPADLKHTFYEKVEYALLGCNCGSVIKQKVKAA